MRNIVAVSVLTIYSSSLSAQKSAVLRVQPQVSRVTAIVETIPDKPRVLVRLTNLARVPLDAWEIHLKYATRAGDEPAELDITYDGAIAEARDQGPVPPGASRERAFSLPVIPAAVSVSVAMALFSDQSAEGSAEEVAFIIRQREHQAQVLDRWIAVLNNIGRSPQQARAALKDALASDPGLIADPTDSWAQAVRQDMTELAAAPDTAGLAERLSAVQKRFTRQREQALRHKMK